MSKINPSIQPIKTLSHFNFWYKPTMMIEAKVVPMVARTQGINILAASCDPAASR